MTRQDSRVHNAAAIPYSVHSRRYSRQIPYTSEVSEPPGIPVSRLRPRPKFTRVRHFWYRVSEGRQIDDLWGQFADFETFARAPGVAVGRAGVAQHL